jgi:hypothetical protein
MYNVDDYVTDEEMDWAFEVAKILGLQGRNGELHG